LSVATRRSKLEHTPERVATEGHPYSCALKNLTLRQDYCSRGTYSNVRVVFSVTLPTGSPSGVPCGNRKSCWVGDGAGKELLRSLEPDSFERFLKSKSSVMLTSRNVNNMKTPINSWLRPAPLRNSSAPASMTAMPLTPIRVMAVRKAAIALLLLASTRSLKSAPQRLQ